MSGQRRYRGRKAGKILTSTLLAGLAVAGCSVMKGPKVPLDASAGMFDRASISYRVETSRINTALRASTGDTQLVSYNPTQSAALPAGSIASMEIKYPHPQKKPGYAQVVVRIEDAAAGSGSSWTRWWGSLASMASVPRAQETWTLDIPQREVSEIVTRLQTSGYFQSYDKADTAKIETELDGVEFNKSWRQLPEMDALIVRVRTEGRLISSIKAPGAADPAQPPAASVAAYREMLAEDAGTAFVSDEPAATIASDGGSVSIVRLPAVDGRY